MPEQVVLLLLVYTSLVGIGSLAKLSLYNHVPVVALPTDWISMSLRISKLGNISKPKGLGAVCI